MAETLGVGGRGDYYDGAGAVRDMIQNQLLQVFLYHAPHAPRLLVVVPPAFHPERLGHRDLDVVDVVPVPDRLQNLVAAPEDEGVVVAPLPAGGGEAGLSAASEDLAGLRRGGIQEPFGRDLGRVTGATEVV